MEGQDAIKLEISVIAGVAGMILNTMERYLKGTLKGRGQKLKKKIYLMMMESKKTREMCLLLFHGRNRRKTSLLCKVQKQKRSRMGFI